MSAEEFLCLLNCTIRFTTPEGDVYEGLLKRVMPSIKTITVGKLYLLPNRTRMGILNFMFREVLNLKVISRTNLPKELIEEKQGASNYIQTGNGEPFDVYGDSEDEVIGTGKIPKQGEYAMKLPPHLSHCVPSDSHIIDSFNDDFNLAVQKIIEEESIGLLLEGPKISRFGTLTWVCISTSSCVYLFDIVRLGKAVFENGLKSVLEDSKIQKIIHDCRLPSDCLHHMYKVRLVNVFDTQVADSLVLMQGIKDQHINKQVNSLDTCLRYFLEIPDDYLHEPREFVMDENSINFHELRPLRHEFQDWMIQNVVYLQLLKRELQTALLAPLRRATDIYLNAIQKASESELLIAPPVLDELPPELTLEGIQVIRFRDNEYLPPVVSSRPPYCKLNNTFEEYKDYCKKYNVGRRKYYSSLFHAENYSGVSLKEAVESNILKTQTTVTRFIPEKDNDVNWYKNNSSSSVQSSKNRETGCAVANMNHSIKTDTVTDLAQLLSKTEFRKVVLKGDNYSKDIYSAVQKSGKAEESKLFPEILTPSKDKFQIKDSTTEKKNKNGSLVHFLHKRSDVKSSDVSVKTMKPNSLSSDASPGVKTFSNIDEKFPRASKRESHELESSIVPADDDIWAALRAECINCYPDDEPRPKLNLIPAGMD